MSSNKSTTVAKSIDAVVDSTTTTIENSSKVTTTSNFWNDIKNSIYSSSDYNLSNELFKELLNQICKNENNFFKFDEQSYETFYTSLISYSCYKICNDIENYSHEQIVNLEHSCDIIIRYLLSYLKLRRKEPVLNNMQILNMIEGLCKSKCVLSASDLSTIVAILTSTNIPEQVTEVVKTPATSSNVQNSLVDMMNSLFLNTNNNKQKVVDSKQSIKEQFQKMNIKLLIKNQGIKAIFNEFSTNLTNLSQFKSKQLKQLYETNDFQLIETYSEAIEVKNSFPQTLNELNYLDSFLSLSLVDYLTNEHINELSNLIQSAFIAIGTVCTSEIIISNVTPVQQQTVTTTTTTATATATAPTETIETNLIQTCLRVYDNFYQLLYASKKLSKDYSKNLNTKIAFLLANLIQKTLNLNINQIQQQYNSTAVKTQASSPMSPKPKMDSLKFFKINFNINTDLALLCMKFLSMMKTLMQDLISENAFVIDENSSDSTQLTIKRLDLSHYFTSHQRFSLFSSIKLFNLLLNLFDTSFKKCQSIYLNTKVEDDNRSLSHANVETHNKQQQAAYETAAAAVATTTTAPSDTTTGTNNDKLTEEKFFSENQSIKDIDASSDDSDYLIGQMFEEQNTNNQNTSMTSANGADDASANSTQVIDTTFELDSNKAYSRFIDLLIEILKFYELVLFNLNDSIVKDLEQSFNEKQLKEITYVINEIETRCERLPERFIHSYLKFMQYLIFKNILNHDKQNQLLGYLGLKVDQVAETDIDKTAWPLFVSKHTLAIMCQIYALRFNRENFTDDLCSTSKYQTRVRNEILQMWTLFLSSIKRAIIKRQHDNLNNDDVNIEHVDFLLFVFHQLPLISRKTVLIQLTQLIVDISDTVESVSMYPPLLISRVFVLLDYIMRNFYEPSGELLEKVKQNILIADSDQPVSTSTVTTSAKKSANESTNENYIESIEKLYQSDRQRLSSCSSSTFKPRFYLLTKTKTKSMDSAHEMKLDGIAVNMLLSTSSSSNSSSKQQFSYNSFYSSLLNLLDAGIKLVDQKSSLSLEEYYSIPYSFNIIWRLLSNLPISLKFAQEMSNLNEFLSKNYSKRGYSMQFLRIYLRLGWYNSVQQPDVKNVFQSELEDCLVKQQQQESSAVVIKELFDQSKQILSETGADFAQNVEFFVKFWSKVLNKVTNVSDDVLSRPIESALEGEQSELTSQLVYNIDLLDYHLNLLQLMLLRQNKTTTRNEQSVEFNADSMKFIVRLVKLYKYHYKRSLLQAKLKNSNLEFNSLLLSSLLHPDWNYQTDGATGCILNLENLESIKSLKEVLKLKLNDISADNAISKQSSLLQLNAYEQKTDNLLNSHIKARFSSSDACLRSFLANFVQFLLSLCKLDKKTSENQFVESLFLELNGDAIACQFSTSLIREYFEGRYSAPVSKNEQLLTKISEHTYQVIYSLFIDFKFESDESQHNTKLFYEILLFIEKNIESSPGLKGFSNVFSNDDKMLRFLMTTFKLNTNINYFAQMLVILNKVFKLNESDGGAKLSPILSQLNKIGDYDADHLQKWLSRLVLPPVPMPPASEYDPIRCKTVLKQLTTYLVNDKSINEGVTLAILNALIQLAKSLLNNFSGIGFMELISLMDILSGSGSGLGHLKLFEACCTWLEDYSKSSLDGFVQSLNEKADQTNVSYLIESICVLLKYISSIINTLKAKPSDFDNEIDYDLCLNDYISDNDELADEECEPAVAATRAQASSQDDNSESGEENGDLEETEESENEELNAKLCTFTITKKEFMSQHWYYCHTCKMVDRIGVCTICANVCHKGHDISYAKYGSFFCDCGAKEEGACKALKKRESTCSKIKKSDSSSGLKDANQSGSSCTPDAQLSLNLSLLKSAKAKQLEKHKQALIECIKSRDLLKTIKNISDKLLAISERQYEKTLLHTNNYQALSELRKLKQSDKKVTSGEELFIAMLGSQEGVFENVRMQYSGEHGQQIKQLVISHQIKRASMCCLATNNKKHLIVTHEKGKTSNFTIIELKALLKQDSNKRHKLTLTKLNTVQVPFTLISIVANPSNEDYIALNGLKDCQIMYLNENGHTVEPPANATNSSATNNGIITLHLSLEGANYIIKSMWLPGSQTELALITSDFIKIYDISIDTISPIYYFLLPVGKVRDVTFLQEYDANTKQYIRYIIIMSSCGYIYYEVMNEVTTAKNEMYYITNTIEFQHSEVKEQNGILGNGGASIYYSFKLQMLFWSYQQGKTFIGSFKQNSFQFDKVFHLSNGTANLQALCNWSEIPTHPGLLLAMTLISNCPVAVMLTPEAIHYQEIKLSATKTKIQDMVVTRHPGSGDSRGQGDEKTTMIILCDDGSLKIYVADMNKTEYWLKPSLNALNPIKIINNTDSYLAMYKARKLNSSRALPPAVTPTSVQAAAKPAKSAQRKAITFPIDFFEKCIQINDIDYGGNDILEIYNVQQLKQRLSNNKYIACMKVNGFKIEITNKDTNSCILGCRVFVGTNALEKVPAYFEVFNRRVACNPARPRWYDIALTRDETYQCENKLVLHIGSSLEQNNVTIVDTIKVYGKTKEGFGWKDDEYQRAKKKQKDTSTIATTTTPAAAVPVDESAKTSETTEATEVARFVKKPFTADQVLVDTQYDRLVGSCLKIHEGCLMLNLINEDQQLRESTVKLLKLMCPTSVSYKAKQLLFSLCSKSTTKQIYFNLKDEAHLTLILESFKQDKKLEQFDWESLQKILLICHSIIMVRPFSLIKFFNENFAKTEQPAHFITTLNDLFWNLFNQKAQNFYVSSVGNPQVQNIELIIEILIEIMHSYCLYDMFNADCMSTVINCYIRFLLCDDIDVSFTARKVLLQLLKPKKKKSTTPSVTVQSNTAFVETPTPTPPIIPLKPMVSLNEPVYQVQVPVDEEIMLPLQNLLLENADDNLGDEPGEGDEFQIQYIAAENYADVDEEEMMQIAMALSMNEQAAAGELDAVEQQEEQQPPPPPQEQQQQDVAGAVASNVQEPEQQQQATSATSSTRKQGRQSKTRSGQERFEQESSNDMSASEEDDLASGVASTSAARQQSTANSDNDEASASAAKPPKPAVRQSSLEQQHQMKTTPPVGKITIKKHEPTTPSAYESEISNDDIDSCTKLYNLRKILLERFLERIDLNQFKSLNSGIKAVPFFQVILTLMGDLNQNVDNDKKILNLIIISLLRLMDNLKQNYKEIYNRNAQNELLLIVMRTISILLSKSKYQKEGATFIIQYLIDALISFNLIDLNLQILKLLFDFWKKKPADEGSNSASISAQLLKTNGCRIVNGHLVKLNPESKYYEEMAPFFAKESSSSSSSSNGTTAVAAAAAAQPDLSQLNDIFSTYTELLTETIIRLPYQIKKVCSYKNLFNLSEWSYYLCEYLMLPQCYFLKRLIKKMLQLLHGSKEKYRKYKDNHILISSLNKVVEICPLESTPILVNTTLKYKNFTQINANVFTYNNLLLLMENFKTIHDIAVIRIYNWQQFCIDHINTVLYFIEVSLIIDDACVPILLQLLTYAIGGMKALPKSQQAAVAAAASAAPSSSLTKHKSKDSKGSNLSSRTSQSSMTAQSAAMLQDDTLNYALASVLFQTVSKETLIKFLRQHLLQSNQVNIRWSMHTLVHLIYKYSSQYQHNQDKMYEIMRELWFDLPMYGTKAAQFIDLIGYMIIKSTSLTSSLVANKDRLNDFLKLIIDLFQRENFTLATHPNAIIYNVLSNMVDFDGFYLENEPCFICNSPETQLQTLKLNSIKADARYTTNTQTFKLATSHSISKIQIKVTDIRKNKMVQTMNIYYNNKNVQSIVELKNKKIKWIPAKKLTLQPSQTDIKIDFTLPIVACNLMIEYADFYENVQVTTETLQCPRCNANVPAHPGVCTNCGENVFQCHKCRTINYDERDPFLCNSCGFCKFAKFEFFLVAKPCSDVDSIENEEDRKNTVQNISNLLDRADRLYKTLSNHTKPALEALIIRMNEQYIQERYSNTSSNASDLATAAASSATAASATTAAAPSSTTAQQPSLAALKFGAGLGFGSQSTTHVNKTVQLIAQKYTSECKTSFEELSKIIQKLNMCRKELKEYDKQFKQQASVLTNVGIIKRQLSVTPAVEKNDKYAVNNCYGCAFACVEHCITLLRALLSAAASNEASVSLKSELCKQGLIEELINFNLKRCFNLAIPVSPTSSSGSANAAPATQQQQQQATATAAPASIATNVSNSQSRFYGRDIMNLIYLLMKDNLEGTQRFNNLMLERVESYLAPISTKVFKNNSGNLINPSSINTLKHEMMLLSALVQKQDDLCWEMRLKLVLQILLRSLGAASPKNSLSKVEQEKLSEIYNCNPIIIESVTLPCLRILNHVCKNATTNVINAINKISSKKIQSSQQVAPPISSASNQQRPEALFRFFSEPGTLNIDLVNYLSYSTTSFAKLNPCEFLAAATSNESYYEKWLRMQRFYNENLSTGVSSYSEKSLIKKCFQIWHKHMKQSSRERGDEQALALKTTDQNIIYDYVLNVKWLQSCLFCPSSRAIRQITCNIVQIIFNFWTTLTTQAQLFDLTPVDSYHTKKFEIAELLTTFLNEIENYGENIHEFLTLYKQIISDRECKFRLIIKANILNLIESLLVKEIRYVNDLERTEMSTTNLTLGYSILCLTDLMSMFLKESTIKNRYKSRLIATILNSYLSLKKLIFQRTKLIEDAQELLLSLLEEMTSGTVTETRKFMSICVNTVNNFDLDDLVTPVYLFERICNIIYPEDLNDNKEFLIVLDKDQNQEDYLQGRMLGNPYGSNDATMGPLMREIKNKICRDCELIALLDDDNGMELLVNNKIISLDLPVRDVYKKVWLAEPMNEHEAMKIVYRMTGLSGDATEDIIENLDGKGKEAKNDEEVYKLAEELALNGALKIMLERLAVVNAQNFTLAKPLFSVLMKLFSYALKLKVNCEIIIKPEMKAVTTMLQSLNMILTIEQDEPNKVGVQLAEQLLSILETILSEASKQPPDVFMEFSVLCGDKDQLGFLLDNVKGTFVRTHSILLEAMMRIIPFLSFGDENKMKALISYFRPYYSNFDRYDSYTTANMNNEETIHLECFSVIVNGVEIGENGKRLRDMMCDGGVLEQTINYLHKYSPKITTYLNSDYDLWKDFISRNALPFVLRILTGLSRSHEKIQEKIGEYCVPLLHKLEQFSSGAARVGVLAEDLLLALKDNPKVASAIEEVQTQTKNEKKRLAMAMRQKVLTNVGVKANEKGQLIAESSIIKNMDEVEEEKGHTCRICREGYKYHPQKALAIYTFSKKVEVDPYEIKTRKTYGYSTVTHFNIVHIDCHSNAIRSARSNRDEWESATLLNANTKCNGLLPLWGPEVTETVFSTALARHNSYLSESTGIRETTYTLSVHDLKLLLMRFAENQSFSEDTGGGGRESNICLVPYLIHTILYSINVARYVNREDRNLAHFFEALDKAVANSFEVDGVYYYLAMSLVVMKPTDWKANAFKFFQRLILTTHARAVNTGADKQKLITSNLLDFNKYKSSILYFGLVKLFHENLNQSIKYDPATSWTETFANYIRNNDIQIVEICKKVLKDFEEELSVSEEWTEIVDVLGLLSDLPEPVEYFKDFLKKF